ncbi:hypothetical protein PENTCL1PPCAC_21160, partial [Pristionchus entomophagus]
FRTEMDPSEAAIGLDLGTESCRISIVKGGEAIIITDKHGRGRTPSAIAFDGDRVLVGEDALKQALNNRENTIFLKDVHQSLGRSEENSAHMISVQFKGITALISPDEVYCLMIAKLKKIAEEFLNSTVAKAVITVPTYYSSCQRQGLKDAARMAGLTVIGVLNSTSAAAIHHSYRLLQTTQEKVPQRTWLVFDQGAGPSDIALFTKCSKYSLTAAKVAADSDLGGDILTNLLLQHFVQKFKSNGQDISDDLRAIEILRRQSEQAKRTLSSYPQAHVQLHEKKLYGTITQQEFAGICAGSFDRTRALIDGLLGPPRLMAPTDVDEILLVGTASRDPNLQSLLRSYFVSTMITNSSSPQEDSVRGAALQAAKNIGALTGDQKPAEVDYVSPHYVWFEVAGSIYNLFEPNIKKDSCQWRYITLNSQAEIQLEINEKVREETIHRTKYSISSNTPTTGTITVIVILDPNGIFEVAVENEKIPENVWTVVEVGRQEKLAKMARSTYHQ